MAKQIVQFSFRTFGRSPHFIKAGFCVYSFIIFSCFVVYFIPRIIGYKLGLVRIPKYYYYRPRHWYPVKTYQRGCWYKKNWIFKKKRSQKKNNKINLKSPISLLSVFTSVLNVDEHCRSRDFIMTQILIQWSVTTARIFASVNGATCFCEIRIVSHQQVATIGVKGHQPSGIITVKCIRRDNSGKLHECLVEDVLFFPQSTINILSITCFSQQLNDLTGTGINT